MSGFPSSILHPSPCIIKEAPLRLVGIAPPHLQVYWIWPSLLRSFTSLHYAEINAPRTSPGSPDSRQHANIPITRAPRRGTALWLDLRGEWETAGSFWAESNQTSKDPWLTWSIKRSRGSRKARARVYMWQHSEVYTLCTTAQHLKNKEDQNWVNNAQFCHNNCGPCWHRIMSPP